MAERVVSVGLIGCGRVAVDRHLPILAALPGARLAAVCDSDAARAGAAARRFGSPRMLRAEELIADPAIEVVAIATPPATHARLSLLALDAGKHLFVEKPLALNLADCRAVAARGQAAGVTAMVGFNLRRHRLVRQAQEMLCAGAIGRPEFVRTLIAGSIRRREEPPAWRNRREEGGGALLELGVLHFDLLRFLLDAEPSELRVARRPETGLELTATVSGRFSSGALLSSVFSESAVDAHELEICGDRGRLRISLYRADGLEYWPVLSFPGDARLRLAAAGRLLSETLHQARHGNHWMNSYRDQWRDLLTAVRARLPVKPDLEDGSIATELALAARDA